MAMHPPPYSDGFAETARQEAETLGLRALELRARAEQWISRGEELLREAETLEAVKRDLDELLGRAPQLRIDLQTTELQGQQLREAAMRILAQQQGTRKPIHYRDWYELLRAQGLTAAGKDPLATFLTQITRSPIVERVEGATGVYQLNPQAALARAREEVGLAQRLINSLRDSIQDSSDRALVEAESRLDQARRRLEAVLQARMTLSRARMSA